MRYLLLLFLLVPSVCSAYPTPAEMKANASSYRQSRRSTLDINSNYHRRKTRRRHYVIVPQKQPPRAPWPYYHYPNKQIPRTTRTPGVTYNPNYVAPVVSEPLTIINPYFVPSEKK